MNEHFDNVGNNDIPCQDIHRAFGDLIIRRLGLKWVSDFDVLRMCPFDAAGGCEGRDLLGIARNVTGQADDIDRQRRQYARLERRIKISTSAA